MNFFRKILFSSAIAFLLFTETTSAQIKVYDKGDIVRARFNWFFARRNVYGQFPAAHYMKVRQEVAVYEKNRLSKTAGQTSSSWTSIGPSAIVNTGYHNYTGRVIAVNVSPFDTNVVLIGTAGGGVWKSTNGGLTWSARSDELGSLAVSCFARHPSDPDIIYAGTGEPSFIADAIDGIGVIKSTDGGDTWNTTGSLGILLTHIAGIVVNQSNPNIVTVANYYNSSDPVTNGIYRSTNAGATWQATNVVGTEFRPSSIIGHPVNNDTLYAVMGRTVTPNQNGIWKSTNAGASWFLLANGSAKGLPDLRNQGGKSAISICRDQPNFMYAIFSNGISGDDELLGSDSGLFKSTDGGLSWINTNLPDQSTGGLSFFNGQGMFDIYAAVHPSDPNKVYAGGIDILKTTNGGSSWSNITQGYSTRKFHPDQQAFAFNPLNPSTIYVVGDGGVMKSYNGGQSFVDLNHSLAITQFIGLAVSASDTNIVLAGSQDNGTEIFQGDLNWDLVADGDGGYTEIDPVNPDIQYGQRYHVAPEAFSQMKTSNRWSTTSNINSGLIASDRSEFYVPYTLDENNPSRLYLGSYRVYRTTNGGSSWSAVSGDLTNGTHTITSIRVAKNNSNYVCAGTFGGLIHLSTNVGANWSSITPGTFPERPISDIAFDPNDESTIYAAFQGFATLGQQDHLGHIWKTTNAGATWTNVSGDLPDIPVNALAVNPFDPNDIVAGTDVGIYRTTDGGVSWLPFNNGFPSGAFVMRLVIHQQSGLLYASTHGRGVFKIPFIKHALAVTLNPRRPAESEAVTVSAAVQEPGSDVKLFYGRNDLLTMDSVVMNFDGTKFSAQIPSSAVTEKGLWYRVRISNTEVTFFPSDSGRANIPVRLSASTITSIKNNGAYASGLVPDTWNAISLPFDTKVALAKIFGSQQYNNNVPTNWAAYSYNQGPVSQLTLTSGTGYVIQHTKKFPVVIGADSAYTSDINLFHSMVLKPGWNLVPWPFAFSSQAQITDPVKIGALWTLVENNWSHASEFKPFAGYAVYNKTASNLLLGNILKWNSVASKTSELPSVQLKCKAGKFEDNFNFAGLAGDADIQNDSYDEGEPPGFGKYLSMYFTNNSQSKLSADFRNAGADGHVWDIQINNMIHESRITVSWEKLNLPAGIELKLIDVTHRVFLDLNSGDNSYTFANEELNRFKLIMGNAGFVETKTEELQKELPERFSLNQNYPNPFNPDTYIPFDLRQGANVKLKVFNILGQEIRTLKDGFMQTGSYAIPWDGKDQRGFSVASGIYIYRLEAGNFIQSRKMILVK
jgi:photosystem II stability/assembly factor-like uncharacterized protein